MEKKKKLSRAKMIHKSKWNKTNMKKILGKDRDILCSIYSEIKTKGKKM